MIVIGSLIMVCYSNNDSNSSNNKRLLTIIRRCTRACFFKDAIRFVVMVC